MECGCRGQALGRHFSDAAESIKRRTILEFGFLDLSSLTRHTILASSQYLFLALSNRKSTDNEYPKSARLARVRHLASSFALDNRSSAIDHAERHVLTIYHLRGCYRILWSDQHSSFWRVCNLTQTHLAFGTLIVFQMLRHLHSISNHNSSLLHTETFST